MIRKVLVLALIACAMALGCNGPSPTAPDPQTPPSAGTPPSTPPAPSAPPTPPALPTPPAPAPTPTRSRFLAFGDSITAGTTSPAVMRKMTAGLPQSYPFKLQSLLNDRYRTQPPSVYNFGLPLEEASAAVRRLPGLLRDVAPDVVILLHGVNDLTGPSVVPRTVAFVDTLARDARLARADVFLCTLPPQRPGGFRAVDPAVVASYNAGIRDVARGEGATLVDFSREMDLRLIGVDGLHPTEAGYDQMALIIFAIVRSKFERSSTSALGSLVPIMKLRASLEHRGVVFSPWHRGGI